MKLLIESAMIFFGTLLAAALVALGEPGSAAALLATAAHRTAAQPVAHGAMPTRVGAAPAADGTA